MKLTLDDKFVNNEVYNLRDNNPEYKKASEAYLLSLKTIDKKASNTIDEFVCIMEALACDTVYKKAFHDGMKFILDTMSGKEVIEL